MDFKGQALFEQLSWIILAIFGILSFAVGYYEQDFGLMVQLYGGSALRSL